MPSCAKPQARANLILANTNAQPARDASLQRWRPHLNGRNSEAGLWSSAVAREVKADGRHMPHGNWNPPWVEWLMGWPIGGLT